MLESFQNRLPVFKDYFTLNTALQYIDSEDKKYEYKEITINPDIAYKYQGNLYGLFKLIELDVTLYIYTMYLNGYINPIEYDGKRIIFKIPVNPPYIAV